MKNNKLLQKKKGKEGKIAMTNRVKGRTITDVKISQNIS